MTRLLTRPIFASRKSQSAFVRGFIDDRTKSLFNIRSWPSQSAFVRGFIDDAMNQDHDLEAIGVSIRVRARLHR